MTRLSVLSVAATLTLAIMLYALGSFVGADDWPSDIPQTQGELQK